MTKRQDSEEGLYETSLFEEVPESGVGGESDASASPQPAPEDEAGATASDAPENALEAVSRAMTLGREAQSQSDALSLASYASRAYLEYAMSVVKSRALPFVSDGQKPVQRRILIDMLRMGLTTLG